MEASRSLVAMVPSLLFGLVEVLGPVACIMVNKLGLRATSLTGATICILAFTAASCSTRVSILILSFSVMGGTTTGNDGYSGDRYSGNDGYSGQKTLTTQFYLLLAESPQ